MNNFYATREEINCWLMLTKMTILKGKKNVLGIYHRFKEEKCGKTE